MEAELLPPPTTTTMERNNERKMDEVMKERVYCNKEVETMGFSRG